MGKPGKCGKKIKQIEKKIQTMYDSGEIEGSIHLSYGQEAVDVGIIQACKDAGQDPFICGNHRSHGQYLQFADGKTLISELKVFRGQHLYIPDRMITTGIQGGLTGVAVGIAYAFKRKGINRRVLCFIGDGTLGQGILYESLGLASLFKVPITFIIIDNNYSMSATKFNNSCYHLAKQFKLNYCYIKNGHLKRTVYNKAINLFLTILPGIIKIDTKRLCGHSCSDTQMYRPKNELTKEYKALYESRN